MHNFQLIWPGREGLAQYADALLRGWSPDNLRPQTAQDELERIERDPDAFLAAQVDREGTGLVKLPDGREVPRIPGYRRWMWDGEFCGVINLRWQRGTTALPPHCLGHIGYTVVPWKRRRGYATAALRLILVDARELGLPFIEITAAEGNLVSRKVIEKNGGVLTEKFALPASYGEQGMECRYRISLDAPCGS